LRQQAFDCGSEVREQERLGENSPRAYLLGAGEVFCSWEVHEHDSRRAGRWRPTVPTIDDLQR
jgi:hypothetical protein